MLYKVLFEVEEKDIYQELSSIRNLMERSTKFISLSGLSGVLAGVYALAGSALAFIDVTLSGGGEKMNSPSDVFYDLVITAIVVLVLSVGTGIFLSIRKARKKNQIFWNPASRALLFSMIVPLFAGGMFILVLLRRGEFDLIASACLIFYGLALFCGSQFTFSDIKWLGICEIALGLAAAALPVYGLIFWAIGFGVLHIIYGTVMHFKYDR